MKYTHTIILLHGFMMKPMDMIYYRDKIKKIYPEYSIRFMIPSSNKKCITIYNQKKYNAWYDYLTNDTEKEPLINEIQLLQSRIKIHKLINKAVQFHNGDAKKYFYQE